jgi:hypothetical protein
MFYLTANIAIMSLALVTVLSVVTVVRVLEAGAL